MTLLEQLKTDEGYKPYAYQDSEGWWTIGYGTLIDRRKGGSIPQDIAELLLIRRADEACQVLSMALPWTDSLDEPRRAVLQNMVYNLGIVKFLGFHKTLAFAKDGDYASAASAMLSSKWATQVGDRAKRLAQQLKTGEWICP